MDTPTVEQVAQTVQPSFTLHDRCDRCGAQAKTRVVLKAGEILLCGHHTHEYREALADQATLLMET